MLYTIRFFSILFFFSVFMTPTASWAESGGNEKNKRSVSLGPASINSAHQSSDFSSQSSVNLSSRGSFAYGDNLWINKFYKFDVDVPTEIALIDTAKYMAMCGDFAPGDIENMWLIDFLDNGLKRVDVSTGEVTFVADLPLPFEEGTWTSLVIHKSSGRFYAIAVDASHSVLCEIDPVSGVILSELDLGIQAAISASFDASGTLFVFGIQTDMIFSVDIPNSSVAELGPAGFDGNYAQGMGYDPIGDEIYLAAYEDFVGPQLRKLNRLSGSTTLLANLPGETGAFGFPVTAQVSGIDFGDAPEVTGSFMTFPTTLMQNGAAHNIDPDVFLGDKIDGESDGQPSQNADGDDLDLIFPSMGDDEDGVTLPSSAYAGTVLILSVKASVDGYLDAWMDFDLDQTWFTPNEHIFDMQPLVKGINKLSFMVPATAAQGQSYLRFRFRNDATILSFDGFANNGEVEDYTIIIKENNTEGFDFGDAPQEEGKYNYPTLLANNAARHNFVPGIYLGEFVDVETDGQASLGADGDDLDKFFPSLGDDEDGVILPAKATPGSVISISLTASVHGYLDAWMDLDQDGTWNGSDEHIFVSQALNPGLNNLSYSIPTSAVSGTSYLRFRFRDYPDPLSFDGIAENGEVEDYLMQIASLPEQGWDFGDAPQNIGVNSFPTLFENNGARHLISPDVYLGTLVDAEPDGQPALGAMGDDQDLVYPAQGDDEDGVVFTSQFVKGSSASLVVTASTDGFLDAWMDFDADGKWISAGEHIFTSQALAAGANNLAFNIPANAATGVSYLRFRFRDYDEPISYDGEVENGEVEDYAVEVYSIAQPEMDFGDAPESEQPFLLSYPTTLARNGAAHIINPEVYLGQFVDAEADGQAHADAAGDDLDIFYPSMGDDEDGVFLPDLVSGGTEVVISVMASVDGYLDAWMDFNLDNSWLSPEEHIFNTLPVLAGVNELSFTVPSTAAAGKSCLRFRFRDDDTPLSFSGIANSGEVEDYILQVEQGQATGYDFGDAPDGLYPSLLASDGARHASDGFTYLGYGIDTESEALQSELAMGDDLDNLDDENGVQFVNTPFVGATATIQVRASVEGYLNAWIDFDQDGSWADAGEQVFTNHMLSAGVNTLTFAIPVSASSGNTFIRFRFGSQTGLSFTGLATDGEVEDYQLTLYPEWAFVPTFITHIIVVPSVLQALQAGDMLGVFYNADDGQEHCGGTLLYDAGQSGQMLAFGDDATSPDIKEGFDAGEEIQWKVYSPGLDTVRDLEVSYDQSYPNYDGLFAPFGMSALSAISLEQNNCELPLGWEYMISGQLHNISIPVSSNPNIYGEPLSSGDWLGVFYLDDDGVEACGGAVQWMGTSAVVLTAYGDDPFTPEKDGFVAGEKLRWKFYDCDAIEVFAAAVSYNSEMSCEGEFGSFCLSELVSIQSMYAQQISLNSGWNSISSYLIPEDANVENMFAPHVGDLVIMQNLTSLYWPYAGVNSIGSWDNETGYALKVSDGFVMEIEGQNFASQELVLGAGWHYLPVLSSCPVDADALLTPVMDKITLVQDIVGTKVWWPEMNVFSLQTLLPGKAYKIRTTQELTLEFPACDYKASYGEALNEANQISTPWGSIKMTPASHLVSIMANAIPHVLAGDYLAAFDQEDNLCGFMEMQNPDQNQLITLFGDDPTTEMKDGFLENEAITFRTMERSTKKERFVDVRFDYSLPNTEQIFNNQGLSAIANLTSTNDLSDQSKVNVYPNPSSGMLHIDGLDEDSSVKVFNAFGEEVMQFMILSSGEINLSGHPKGVYFIQIEMDKASHFEKVILN